MVVHILRHGHRGDGVKDCDDSASVLNSLMMGAGVKDVQNCVTSFVDDHHYYRAPDITFRDLMQTLQGVKILAKKF